MSLPLLHSPAEVIRALLVASGLTSDPPAPPTAPSAWPCYATNEPSTPDDCVTVYDTAGRMDGRDMVDGQQNIHRGVQVRVRSTDHPTGYQKAEAVAVWLDEGVNQAVVTISSNSYLVFCVNRTGDVLVLGKNVPGTKRSLFTINLVAPIRRLT